MVTCPDALLLSNRSLVEAWAIELGTCDYNILHPAARAGISIGGMCAMIDIWWCMSGHVELLYAVVSTRSVQSWWPSHVGEVTAALSQWTDEDTVAPTRMIHRIYILKHGFVCSFLPCASFSHVSLSLKETEIDQESNSRPLELSMGLHGGRVYVIFICLAMEKQMQSIKPVLQHSFEYLV